MTKILILQGGFNEEHKVSLNTSKEIAKVLKKLKINFNTLTVNPITFEVDILKYPNDYVCFNALHGPFGEDGKIQKILKKYKFKVTHSNQNSSSNLTDELIILKADFSYKYSSASEIIEKKNYIKLKRQSSQPIKEKTSGSTFKNPSGKYAAALIERAGCKGMKNGDASVSTIHSNFIINNGEATALDIENLGKQIIKQVQEKFGIRLEWEIKIIGK